MTPALRSNLQQTLLRSLSLVLQPLVRLCLRCGIGYGEFRSVARAVFVMVASEEYGIRGRPTNVSRVAALTGISRKEIRKVRDQAPESRWTPAMEISPANLLIHYWHFDGDFSEAPGSPLPLPIDGPRSFSELARRYAGDIPVGAIKEELKRAAVVSEVDGTLIVQRRFFQPFEFDPDFIRNIIFAMRNLACTVVHNAGLVSRPDFTEDLNVREGRFERFAWSERLDAAGREDFRQWVRSEGAKFIEKADHWIGESELPGSEPLSTHPRSIGVGVYFFEEEPDCNLAYADLKKSR